MRKAKKTEHSISTRSLYDAFDLNAFDLQTLEQAADLLKDDLEVAVDEYLEDAAAYIRDIEDGLKNGDTDQAARGSHTLKSNSKSFGLTSVSLIAEMINKKTRVDQTDGVETLLPLLQSAFHRAEKKLREYIKRTRY